jgi:hypothetical protein
MLTTNSLRGHGGSSVVCCSPSRDISAARAPLLRKGGREEGGVGGREREIERERESARARERERTERERRESERDRKIQCLDESWRHSHNYAHTKNYYPLEIKFKLYRVSATLGFRV